MTFGNGDQSCISTNEVQIEVRDPCTLTSIYSQSIDSALVATSASSDAVMISGWMLTDSVDMSREPVGTHKCGNVVAVVTDMSGNPVDYASFDNETGELRIDPNFDTAPGTY